MIRPGSPDTSFLVVVFAWKTDFQNPTRYADEANQAAESINSRMAEIREDMPEGAGCLSHDDPMMLQALEIQVERLRSNIAIRQDGEERRN